MDSADSRALPAGPPLDIRASPRTARRHRPGPALQGLLALVIYLAAFAGYAAPMIRQLGLPVLGRGSPDSNFYVWAFRWLPYAIAHGLNPLFSSQIGAPGGVDLTWSTPAAPLVLVMWPVTAAFGPVAAYNLCLLLLPPVSGWAAFVAARRLTGRFWASLLGGAVYGACPFLVMHGDRGDLNLVAVSLFPLLVYLVLLWRDGALGRTGFILWMAAILTLQFYVFMEFFADVTVLLAVALLTGYAVAGPGGRPAVARLAALTAIAWAGAVVLTSPFLVYALPRYPNGLTRLAPDFSLRLVRLVLPSWERGFGLSATLRYSSSLGSPATDAYVGVPLLVLLVLLAVFTWKSGITRVLVLTFCFIIAMAAGPDLIVSDHPVLALPWGGLWSLPITRSAEPDRLVIFGFLILAIAVARWLAAPGAGRLAQGARWGLGVLALVAILADMPKVTLAVPAPVARLAAASMRPPAALPPFFSGGLYRRYLRPGEIVVIVSGRGNAGMLFQACSGFYFRLAGGYINQSLSQEYPLPVAALAAPAPAPGTVRQFEDYMRDAGVGAVIVDQVWAQPWMRVFGRMGLHATSVGGVTIYQPAV